MSCLANSSIHWFAGSWMVKVLFTANLYTLRSKFTPLLALIQYLKKKENV